MPPASHWHHVPVSVPYRYFGMGSLRPFDWYFGRESTVKVVKIAEICKWLAHCKYQDDASLFGRPDVWQHPVDFELLKKGDCDDHALWAWRKLRELNLPAQLVCGKWYDPKRKRERPEGHAWVLFKKRGKKSWHVLECTGKDPKKMIISLKDGEKNYFPELSVDTSLQTYRFMIAKNCRY